MSFIWHEFEAAETTGKYFLANIRGQYQENRIN